MQQVFPGSYALDGLAAITAAYAYPREALERPYVRANMVATADGAAYGPNARTGSISSQTDKRVFGILRGLADVVLVGAGTVRTEGYGPVPARTDLAELRATNGQRPAAAMAVVSRSLDLDPASALFTTATEPTIVLTTEDAPRDRHAALAAVTPVLTLGQQSVDLDQAFAALGERGLTRVLCEGGPVVLAEVAAAGRLDELCLTVSPLLTGGAAPRVLDGPDLVDPAHLQLVHVLEDHGTLLLRWRQAGRSTSARS